MKLITVLSDRPIRSLLPIRFLKPAEVLLVGRREMHAISQHLATLLEAVGIERGPPCPPAPRN